MLDWRKWVRTLREMGIGGCWGGFWGCLGVLGVSRGFGGALGVVPSLSPPPPQVLRYFDYVFTGVFTFEMVIKVRSRGGVRRFGGSPPEEPPLTLSPPVFPADGGSGAGASPRFLFPGFVEYSGFHRGQRGFGGFCLHVSDRGMEVEGGWPLQDPPKAPQSPPKPPGGVCPAAHALCCRLASVLGRLSPRLCRCVTVPVSVSQGRRGRIPWEGESDP